MMGIARRFLAEQDSPTMVEYAFLAVFIALAVFVSVGLFGTSLRELFLMLAKACESYL